MGNCEFVLSLPNPRWRDDDVYEKMCVNFRQFRRKFRFKMSVIYLWRSFGINTNEILLKWKIVLVCAPYARITTKDDMATASSHNSFSNILLYLWFIVPLFWKHLSHQFEFSLSPFVVGNKQDTHMVPITASSAGDQSRIHFFCVVLARAYWNTLVLRNVHKA